GADRICFGILLSCIVTGTDACPRGALSRTGPVSFPCSAIAVDEPTRKTNTAKAANVVIRFMRTNPFWTTGPFLADFIGSVQRTPDTRLAPKLALGPPLLLANRPQGRKNRTVSQIRSADHISIPFKRVGRTALNSTSSSSV